MFRRALTLVVMLTACISLTAQSHKLPTTDGTNSWTGVNTYVPGNLKLGSNSQVCSGSQVMNGFTNTFTPLCQVGSGGVASVNTLSGALTLAAGTNIGLVSSGNTITISSTATNGVTNVNSITGAVTIAAGANITVTPSGNTLTIAGTGGGVSSVNTLTGAVVFAAGSNITLTPSGNTVTIASTGGAGGTGVTSLNGSTGALNITAGTNITVTPSGSNISIAATGTAAGVSSVNSLTGAVVLAAGANVTLTPSGNTVTIASTGGGGSGSLNTLPNDTLTNTAGNAAQDMFNFMTGTGYTNQNAVNAAAAHNGVATLLPSALSVPTGTGSFTNSSNVKVNDLANLAASLRSLTEFGAQCNTRQIVVSVPLSSTTATISGDFFKAWDVGSTLTLVGTVGGIPTAFETVIVAQISPSGGNSATAQLTTAAPVAFSFTNGVLGHDDTAAIASGQAAMAAPAGTNGYAGTTTLQIPGSTCLTHAIAYTGFSLSGVNQQSSILAGFPGETILAFPDTSTGSSGQGDNVHLHDFTARVDNRIDATLPWQIINDSGTTSKAALYQPTGILTAGSSNPGAPGWFQGSGYNLSGAINGVGAINSGSPTLMTVPAGVTLPTAAQKIVFPYLTTVLTTTVSSVNTGTRVVTLAASYTGVTGTQIEWFAGTSPQNLAGAITSGSCPASITLSNPIAPAPGFEANVAPAGLIQIDAEQFTYSGKANAAFPGQSFLTITACGQNGTSRANHSIGATVVPLNPFKPTTPWPVTPTINAGFTTPLLAAYYPAWNVGNGFMESPVANGATGRFGVGSFSNSVINNITVQQYPTSDAFNHTAGIYLVNLPYSTSFKDLVMTAYFPLAEGVPAFNSGAGWAAAQPTADGSRWEGIRLNGCDDMSIVASNQNTYKDFNMYSQCESSLGTTIGANTAWYISYGWNDQTGGILSAVDVSTFTNMYAEPETGVQYGLYPIYEMDGFNNLWDDMHMGGGGENIVGGTNQHWRGGNFNNTTFFPTIDYGSGNSSDYTTLLNIDSSPISNIYGTSGLIEFGNNSNWIASTGPFGNGAFGPAAIGLSNTRQPIPSQTNETFNLGNLNPTFVSSNGGFIPASEFNSSFSYESNPFPVPWHYDGSLLPDGTTAGGAVGCLLSGTPTNNCFSFRFNQGAIYVGPGQRIAAGKYTMYIASKSTGAASQYTLSLGACSPGNVGSYTVPVGSSYTIFSTQVDFTGNGTCGGGIGLGFGFGNAADTLSVAYVDFAPVAQKPTDFNVNILNQVLLNGNAGTAGQCLVSGGTGAVDVWGTCGSGGGGSGITGLSGDVLATGTGTVAASVKAIGGGAFFSTFTGLLQNTAGVVSQASSVSVAGFGQFGTRVLSAVNTVVSSATPVFDLSLGDTQFISLTTNVGTSTIINPPPIGYTQHVRFIICQDATGGRTFTYPVSFQGTTPVTLTAGSCTSEFFNVTNTQVYADNYNSQFSTSSASPSVAGAAYRGYFAIAAGVNPTVVVNTTAVGAQSVVLMENDQSIGAAMSPTVTCNTTPLQPSIASKVVGTSFTASIAGTVTTNPICVAYTVVNP